MEQGPTLRRTLRGLALLTLLLSPLFFAIPQAMGQAGEYQQATSYNPVIDITKESFASRLTTDDSSWIAGELLEARLVKKVREGRFRFPVPCDDYSVYDLRLKVERNLFGGELPLQTLDLKGVRFPYDGGYQAEDAVRPPRSGDRIFGCFIRNADRSWKCVYVRIPNDAERARIDRVKRLVELPDARQAAQKILSGCRSDDPHFAIWCINALYRHDRFDQPLSMDKTAYGRLHAEVTLADYRATLFDILDSLETPSPQFIHATEKLTAQSSFTDAEVERLRQAHCRRLLRLLSQTDDSPYFSPNGELNAITSHRPPFDSDSHRRNLLAIFQQHLSGATPRLQMAAFDWVTELYSDQDAQRNAGIFRLFRDHFPQQQDAEWTKIYWHALKSYMACETSQTDRICDAGLDLFEQRLPLANEVELEQMTAALLNYENATALDDAEWKRFSARLIDLYRLAVNLRQKTQIKEMLRSLKITLPKDVAT